MYKVCEDGHQLKNEQKGMYRPESHIKRYENQQIWTKWLYPKLEGRNVHRFTGPSDDTNDAP